MKTWAVIKDDVVIDSVLWDGETEWEYPFPYDELIEITEELKIGIDWWKDEEGNWNEPDPNSYLDSGFSEEYPDTEEYPEE